MASHSGLALISMIMLAGSIVMIFFVILAGLSSTAPLNNTYFLQADTGGIAGARPVSQWTYFYVCGPGNTDCSSPAPAPAFGHNVWEGPNPSNAPAELVGDHDGGTTSTYYFYMWRFGWVLYLIALFFDVCAFFSCFLACFGRLGAAVSGLVATVALFFFTIAVSLMTATFVKARNAFLAENRAAQIGTYAFGFSWGAWAALFIATVLLCLGTRGRRSDQVYSTKGGFGRRRRSTRSRRSYEMGSRRVKDDYA